MERKSKKQKKKEERRKAKAAASVVNDDGVDVDAMDVDVIPRPPSYLEDDEDWDGTEETRKQKLDEYMDELYGLEFNDIVSAFVNVQRTHTDENPGQGR